MKFPFPTLRGQLLFLFLTTLLLSQAFIVFVFMLKADEISDFEEETTLTSVYRAVSSIPREERPVLLSLVNTAELHFTIAPTPLATDPVRDPDIAALLRDTLGDVPSRMTSVGTSVGEVWRFWFFDDVRDDCLISDPATLGPECPRHTISLALADGEWLNATIDPEPNVLVVVLPVLISAFLGSLGVIAATLYMVTRITRPLRKLSIAADRLGRGESAAPLEVDGPVELASLATTFNLMQERLVRFVADRTRMLAAISHDLRTPLTSLRLRAEFVKDPPLQEAMIRTLEDLQTMVEASLTFAQHESTEEALTRVDLVETLEELAEERPEATLESVLGRCPYDCRAVSLKRAIRNLVDNAVKYGGSASVSLSATDDEVAIAVRDTGLGVPEDKLGEIFEPFVRLDKARNTESGSVGLGLSISRTIVHRHGGRVAAANTADGFEVVIYLPRLADAAEPVSAVLNGA